MRQIKFNLKLSAQEKSPPPPQKKKVLGVSFIQGMDAATSSIIKGANVLYVYDVWL